MSTLTDTPVSSPEKTCPDCGSQHTGQFRKCPDCVEKIGLQLRAADKSTSQTHRKNQLATAWSSLCPPIYRSSDWEAHPELSPICRQLAHDWRIPAASAGTERGLLITGPSGRGKTRTCYQILRRLHFGGFPCMAAAAIHFAQQAGAVTSYSTPAQERWKAQRFFQQAKTSRVFFLDDLGKDGGRESPGFGRMLHDVLEHRCSHLLPTLVTTERVGEELAQFLGTNYADGIVRRLREMCQIFHTDDLPRVSE